LKPVLSCQAEARQSSRNCPYSPCGWLLLARHADAEIRTVFDWFGHEMHVLARKP
jgi:hypothetical protein